MMDAPTFRGTLTDFEGGTARINDNPLPMTGAAEKWCASRLKKGMKVAYYLTDGKISKIWEDKSAPEGAPKEPAESTQKAVGACTPPPGLKTVEGQIIFIDYGAHKVTLKDRPGATHTFIWSASMHDKMSQLKQWWFAKLTGEHEKEADLWRLTAQDFFKRPDDWPYQGGKGGGRQFQPRNEKLIVAQCLVKAYTDLYIASNPPDGVDFNTGRETILAAVEQDVDRVMKAGGA